MITAMLEQRVGALEKQVRSLRALVQRDTPIVDSKRLKKLPRGLQIALREIEEGKEIGPFHTVEAFMSGLK